MQTFVALPSFWMSARILDDARLRKQQVEAQQILNALKSSDTKRGWANHPAVLQWKSYEDALTRYLNAIAEECERRGFKARFHGPSDEHDIYLPLWWGNKKVHATHRSRLLFKGRVDAAALALKSTGVKKVNQWLVEHGYPVKNLFTQADIAKLETMLYTLKVELLPNHYRQYWPDEPDNLPYLWPVTKAGVSREIIIVK
jgi:hypothetical protein